MSCKHEAILDLILLKRSRHFFVVSTMLSKLTLSRAW